METSYVNLAAGGCVKRVKLGGKNGVTAGGKTPFCDITDAFMVSVDTNGDGIADANNVFIYSSSASVASTIQTHWTLTNPCTVPLAR